MSYIIIFFLRVYLISPREPVRFLKIMFWISHDTVLSIWTGTISARSPCSLCWCWHSLTSQGQPHSPKSRDIIRGTEWDTCHQAGGRASPEVTIPEHWPPRGGLGKATLPGDISVWGWAQKIPFSRLGLRDGMSLKSQEMGRKGLPELQM